MIVCKNDFEKPHFSEPSPVPDLIDFRDFSNTEPKLEYMIIPTDCENVSESMHFSKPDVELDLIDSRDCTNTEPRLDYILKSIECKNMSEKTHLSEHEIELSLIASVNPSKTEHKSVKNSKFETKYTDFSEPEPKLKNLFEVFP